MTRLNRAQRRAQKHRPNGLEAKLRHVDEMLAHVAILPGLPGSLYDCVSQVDRDAIMEAEATAHLDAIGALHPGMMWRAYAVRREIPLGIPEVPPIRLRHVKAAAPDGLGQGVVLGEFTSEPERPVSRLIMPGEGSGLLQLGGALRKRSENAAAARRFLEEFGP